MWELGGVDDNGVPHDSLNHYSKGAVIGFLHRYVVGIERSNRNIAGSGCGHVPVRADVGPAEHDAPHGRLAAS